MTLNKCVLTAIAAGIAAALTGGSVLAAANITSTKGITIGGAIGGAGGKFVAWGGTVALAESDSFLQSNGHCAFNVSYDMENPGDTATGGPFKNWLVAKSNTVAINSGLALNAGETKQINTQPYLPQGTYDLQLKLDAENSIAESNETDNLVSVKINFAGTCGAALPAPKPDLLSARGIVIGGAVGGGGGKTSPWGGSIVLHSADAFLQSNGKCAFNISYDIANTGLVAAGPAFVNRIYSGANVVSQQSGLSLDAGKAKLISTQAYLTPGQNVVRLVVDADNNIVESNEANNTTEVKVTVDSTCRASLPPTSTQTKPETKPDTKPVTKPETKPETKPDTKPVTKPETKPETKPDTKPVTKPETKTETKRETATAK